MPNRLPIALSAVALFGGAAAAQKPAASNEIPRAISAIREADLRHDIGEMASPEMRPE